MRTMHSVLKRGGLYWDHSVLPAEAYQQRMALIQEAVRASGDSAWLLFGDVERYGMVTFATNFMPRVRSTMAFVPAEGPPVLFANIGKRDVPAAKTITWVEEIVPFGRLPGDLIKFLEARALASARIGLAGFDASIPVTDWEAIAKGLPNVVWSSRDDSLWSMRASKSQWEVDAIARSARIGDDALAQAPAVLKPGVTMRAAIAAIDRRARSAGAEDVRYMVASGPQAAHALRPVDDRILAAGDTVLIYAAVGAQRYWAETARTFVLGKASVTQHALHTKAGRILAAIRQASGVGASYAAVAAAAGPGSPYGLGNAIGLDACETPLVASGVTASLAHNATLAIRAILHEQGAAAAVAQTIVAVNGGATEINSVAPLIEVEC